MCAFLNKDVPVSGIETASTAVWLIPPLSVVATQELGHAAGLGQALSGSATGRGRGGAYPLATLGNVAPSPSPYNAAKTKIGLDFHRARDTA